MQDNSASSAARPSPNATERTMAHRKPSPNLRNSDSRRIVRKPLRKLRQRSKSHAGPGIFPRLGERAGGGKPQHVATATGLWHPGPVEELPDPAFDETNDPYYAANAAQRLSDWLETLSADVIVHEPAGSPPAEGREGAGEAWKVLTAPFRSLAFERVRTFFSGSGAAVYWRCRAVGVNGGSATGEGITIFEFDDESRVQAVVSYWDPAALLIELADGEDEPLH